MTATTLSPVLSQENKDRFNDMFRYMRRNGAWTDEAIAELDRDAAIQLQQTAHIFSFYYRGDDEFLRKMNGIASGNSVLSIRQCRAVLNGMYREGMAILREKGLAAPPVVVKDERPVATTAKPNGYYTVNMGDGTHVTLLLEEDFRDTAPEGSQIAKYLFASDNTSDYAGFAFVTAGRIGVWSKQRGKVARQQAALEILLGADTETARAYGEAYAIESGRCARCGRLLTVEASVARGLGPECAKKGWNE